MRSKRPAHGNTLIQAALVLPLLVMLGMGGAEYGYFFSVKSSVQAAAREGSRASTAITATNSTVTTAISDAMTNSGLGASGYTVTLSPTNMVGLPSGQQITVTVNCPWSAVGVRALPASLGGIPSTKMVSVSVVMNRE